ncbi:MAG: hypothetical protein ABSD52_11465 [Candidatus Cybelea sp.]
MAAALLAGCSTASQSQLGPSEAGRQNLPLLGVARSGAVLPAHANHGRSWMAPGAKKKALLYISNYGSSQVLVYSYPGAQSVGWLTSDIDGPDGLCADTKGNVWIVNYNGSTLVEYAHGGTSPIATLSDPNENPLGCSVDPITGNLAATNMIGPSGGQGDVVIYPRAKGTAKVYVATGIYYVFFCGYDDSGNLYVDGRTQGEAFAFSELAKGSSTFTPITLTGGKIYLPGNVRWDGKYVAIGDQEYHDSIDSGIYQTTGSGGKIVGSTALTGSEDVVGFWIQGKTVIGPDALLNNVGFYRYPKGGSPTKTLTSIDETFGAAVSL